MALITKIPEERQTETQADIEIKFNELVKKWKEETLAMSSLTDICTDRNYQRIIALGKQAIPLILKELEKESGHWFWALEVLIDENENPITPDIANDFLKTKEAWIRWGREN